MAWWTSLLGAAVDALRTPAAPASSAPPGPGATTAAGGRLEIEYRPDPDGDPDPGEIVWTWVAFEDDPTRGKDRPVLLVGRLGDALAGLMLTSKDHDRDAAHQAARGRVWLDIGAGSWDPQHRPSEVRLDRLLRIDPARVRREGATVPRDVFDRVVVGMREARGERADW